jgi:hypothetical protein
MGRTVRFDQIFVTSLDAAPRETDVLSGLASIDAGEITADQIEVANLTITNKVTANVESTEFTGLTNVFRFTATQVGIGTDNPINEFQLGSDSVIMNRELQDLVTIQGNTVSTNLFATSTLKTTNDKFFADANASNVLKITGNTFSTNAAIGTHLLVGNEAASDGSNIAVFEKGNVVVRDGFLRVFGDVDITGNLAITEIPDYTSVNNLVVSNAVIQMAFGNNGTYDMALLMKDVDEKSNIFFGYTHAGDKMRLSRTYGGPTTATFDSILDTSNTVNLHVYGDIYTQNNVGIANSSPTLSLSVGSNVHIDDTATTSSNVLYANGFGFFEGLRIGDSGLTVGSLITLDADAAIPMVVSSTIQSQGLQTTGVDGNGDGIPSGIANTTSTNMLSIGDKIFINSDSANLITVLGNTATGRLITESILVQDFIEVEGESGISSAANVIIHGDINGEDSVSNTLSLRCGPLTANISAIELNGAKTSASHQTVVLKTKNTERMRVASGGNIGISNTEPDELLTLGGNLKLIESNTAIFGNGTNFLKIFTDITNNQTRIQNRVGSGKGLNFYASTTDTMGTPKLTILESSNVGVGTISPVGLLHTNGGTVFINDQVVKRGPATHLDTPLVVTNTSPATTTSDFTKVLQLTREGAASTDGVRSIFKMGKHGTTANQSQTQMNLALASDSYENETHVMTWRSDKRIGIGTTTPSSHLEIITSGIGNFNTNGLLIHSERTGSDPNFTADDAVMTVRADHTAANAFTSFVQTAGNSPAAISGAQGYSMGVTGSTVDFRLTKNPNVINDPATSRIFISGSTGNMGIGTDAPRVPLEVNGNVIVGNQLSFTGVETDELGNTFIRERYYNTDGKTELVTFKGNEGALASVTGPDRIRSVAPLHIFQTYDSTGLTEGGIEALIGSELSVQNALLTVNKDRVLVGTSVDPGGNSRLFVDGGFQFATGSKVITGVMDIFSVTTGGNKGVIDNISSALTFRQSGIEYARFTEEGLFGLGTSSPDTNVHVYSALTTDVDILKLESPANSGTKKAGISLTTDTGKGGYVRGFSDSTHSVHGTVMGAVNGGTEADGIHIIHTSNVGVGTVNPSEHFTVYNGTARLEHATSNAILEFKTTGGVSNIYGDHTGNVFIDPVRSLVVKSDTEITGDLQIDGKIDLGNQVAVDLGGSDATTALHVGGGFISGSNEVGCKRYSKSFTLGSTAAKSVRLYFADGGTPEKMPAFYAKIVAMLRKTDGSAVRDMSTMVLEIQGGSHDGTTNSSLDDEITVGTKNLFGGDSDFPWSPNITVGKKGVLLTPHDIGSGRIYKYDIHVELITASLSGTHTGGFLKSIKNNVNVGQVDSFGAGQNIVTFTY